MLQLYVPLYKLFHLWTDDSKTKVKLGKVNNVFLCIKFCLDACTLHGKCQRGVTVFNGVMHEASNNAGISWKRALSNIVKWSLLFYRSELYTVSWTKFFL